MKHISVKMTDVDYQTVEKRRGDKTKSEYVRMLLTADDEHVKKEAFDFQKLFSDVTLIKESLTGFASKTDLLALARFVVEVVRISNPISFSHEQMNVQQQYQTLVSHLQGKVSL